MAEKVRNIAPFVDVTFYVTSIFGEDRASGKHKAVDIATPAPGSPLYSIVNGKVIYKQYDSSYGYYIIIKGNDGNAFLYAHLREESPLQIGDLVVKGSYVGFEGSTGTSTGIHLHLEQQFLGDSDTWIFNQPFENMINPCDYMGIDNIKNTSWIYDGYIPPTPTLKKRKKYNFILFNKKNRRST